MSEVVAWKNINWLWIASAFTLSYLLFFVFWIGSDRIIAFTSTNALNEVGDFLAGVFSPLAFIWLVAAVLTQRQELTETRDQFAENQKVVDAQLGTINEQSMLLQQQHALAEETAKKTYRLSLFEQRFEIYVELVKLHASMTDADFSREHLTRLQHLSARTGFVFSQSLENHFSEIEASLAYFLDKQEKWEKTWTTDVYSRRRKPETEVSLEIERGQQTHRKTLLDSIHPLTLQALLRSSIRISDD